MTEEQTIEENIERKFQHPKELCLLDAITKVLTCRKASSYKNKT